MAECSVGTLAAKAAPSSSMSWSKDMDTTPTVVHAMHQWVARQPDKVAYTWVDQKGRKEQKLTYRDFSSMAITIADAMLGKWGLVKGDRVLLIYPIGLNFVVAFWACLRAGVVAVPLYPVRQLPFFWRLVEPAPGSVERDLVRLKNAVADCSPRAILTDAEYLRATMFMDAQAALRGQRLQWPAGLKWHSTDDADLLSSTSATQLQSGDCSTMPLPNPTDLAFIQYTSGSTAEPKGVMIQHSNLVANLTAAFSGLQVYPSDVLVTWLPQYHDLGLIGYFIDAIVVGASCVAFSPFTFVRRPHIWMQIMSTFKGTITSAPNFGYALAARKTLAEQVASLDLRHVRILMDAAEPVRQVHVDAFLKRHAPAGLPAHAYMPGYGLAEHVIFVTGLQHQRELSQRRPTFLDIRKDIFEEQSVVEVVSRTRTEEKREKAAETVAGDDGDAARLSNDDNVIQLVGCGRPFSTVEVLCVDQGTHQVVPEGRVGEVWITGPSVAKGYWGKPQLTAKNFEARLVSSVGDVADESCNKYDSRKFLRTGDLGFFHDDELFICGRQKDLIIIGGRNISPQDVERDVEESHEDLRRGCSAAFSIEEQGEERMVVVAEVRDGKWLPADYENIATAISATVQQYHKLVLHALLLLPPRSICKTTSGKIQRKRWFLNGHFAAVHAQGGAYRQLIKPSKSRAQDVTSTLIAFVTKLQRSSMTDLASGQGDTRAMSNIVIACTVAYITIWILEYYQAARGEDLIAPLGKSGTPDALYY
ncbi:hypothetical protein CYMTET_24267 [Cymbomonas tetramitiformis]|uniref:AMP-dependent synthetase/ligase domain-containing protein n=1 Tax=Cymbomonas tetramitiformis TaxID=36881 RepID=A0AAE0FWX3_9CHLO|nr:hypothetical protein CYMTET_24267 [Cymbomonas tetramitiformis]